MDSAFEPAGTLEAEENVLVDDDISNLMQHLLLLLMQLLTTFPTLMMICPTPNQLEKEEKQHQRNNSKGWIQLNELKEKT